MKRQLRNYFFLIIIAGLIILADQASKNWVRENLAMGETYCVIDSVCEKARFVHWYNTGVAFGMFQGNSNLFKVTSSIIALAIIAFYSQIPDEEWLLRLALAFEVGGAVGNLIDRFMIGHVTDFVAVGNFAVFNIADAAINVGIAFMLLSLLLDYLKEQKEKKAAVEAVDSETPVVELETSSD